MPDAVKKLPLEFGEALVVPLAEALLKRDVDAATRHARVIAETKAGVATLRALARKRRR